MNPLCSHYPWSLINEQCPTCEKSKCTHYPWSLIDDTCKDCEEVNPYSSFYCNRCNTYTKHTNFSKHILCCEKCNNQKGQLLFTNSDNVSPYGLVPLNQKCLGCNTNKVAFMGAKFNYNFNGMSFMCIDNYRPLCGDCHDLICIRHVHNCCNRGRAKL
jgi:hypothetical protein